MNAHEYRLAGFDALADLLERPLDERLEALGEWHANLVEVGGSPLPREFQTAWKLVVALGLPESGERARLSQQIGGRSDDLPSGVVSSTP